MVLALTGARVFDGETMREGLAVVIKDTRIVEVIPQEKISSEIECRILDGGILAPGFIDVQVNGGGGALLNDNPSIETVKRIASAHRKFGTTGMLPTVITDAPHILAGAIAAVTAANMSIAKTGACTSMYPSIGKIKANTGTIAAVNLALRMH